MKSDVQTHRSDWELSAEEPSVERTNRNQLSSCVKPTLASPRDIVEIHPGDKENPFLVTTPMALLFCRWTIVEEFCLLICGGPTKPAKLWLGISIQAKFWISFNLNYEYYRWIIFTLFVLTFYIIFENWFRGWEDRKKFFFPGCRRVLDSGCKIKRCKIKNIPKNFRFIFLFDINFKFSMVFTPGSKCKIKNVFSSISF